MWSTTKEKYFVYNYPYYSSCVLHILTKRFIILNLILYFTSSSSKKTLWRVHWSCAKSCFKGKFYTPIVNIPGCLTVCIFFWLLHTFHLFSQKHKVLIWHSLQCIYTRNKLSLGNTVIIVIFFNKRDATVGKSSSHQPLGTFLVLWD